MVDLSSLDLVVYSNYEEEGTAFTRAMDHIGDCWPDFRMREENEDEDTSLAAYLTGDDVHEWEVLTGEVEDRCSWVAHQILLPFAFDLNPWVWSREEPAWWVRIQYAEVIDQLRIEVYRRGELRRLIRISSELPWVLYGDPFPWEAEFWDGRQPRGGEFADAPHPLTPKPLTEQVPLPKFLVLQGGGLPRHHRADLGTVELRDGRPFWRALKPTAKAHELAASSPGSFIDDDGLDHIDLEHVNLRPDPALVTDSEEWPDIGGLCEAALHHLLGIRSMDDLDGQYWTGILLRATEHLD